MLAILDYKAGNQTSVRRALEHLGVPCAVTADATVIAEAEGLIFPGVGAAGAAMNTLREAGLDVLLRQRVAAGQPLLGICLGCQILLEESEEGPTPTLGLLPGRCRRFDPALTEPEPGGDLHPVRIPHMGWNTLSLHRPGRLLDGLSPDASFYFVHSYHVETSPDLCLATCHYGLDFCAVLGRDGLWGVQFHPEKSGEPGLRILRNFYDFCQSA